MSGLSIRMDSRQVDALTLNLAPRMKKALLGGLRKAGAQVETTHKRKVLGRGSEVKDDVWSVRSNEAGRSFHRVIDAQAMEMAYGSELARVGVIEMGTQEALGGPLKPRNGTYLAIPTEHAKVGVGRALSPKDWPKGKLAFVQSLKGNPLLIDSDPPHDVMFILRRSVTIKPRQTLARTQEIAQPLVDAAMLEAVEIGFNPTGYA